MGHGQERRRFASRYRDDKVTSNMILKIPKIKDKVFIAAIIASLAWHLFWLSAIKIVSAPQGKAKAKFSKVYFLGPISERVTAGASSIPREPSFLEKRYLNFIGELPVNDNSALTKDSLSSKINSGADKALVGFIQDTLGEPKLEPVLE